MMQKHLEARLTRGDIAGLENRRSAVSPLKTIPLLEAISSSIELDCAIRWGLSDEKRMLSLIASTNQCDLKMKIPSSRANVRDTLYHVAETSEHESVREAARQQLKARRSS